MNTGSKRLRLAVSVSAPEEKARSDGTEEAWTGSMSSAKRNKVGWRSEFSYTYQWSIKLKLIKQNK